MGQFTPFIPTPSFDQEQVKVLWSVFNVNANWQELAERYHTMDATPSTSFNTSFIECKHPEGKWWKSMFIPLNTTGSYGVSITWWGKDLKVKGQFQVKRVGEKEWYGVVKSKAVAKGYDVLNYIGRYTPVDSGHQFVNAIVTNPDIAKLPPFAFDSKHATEVIGDSTMYGLGRAMGTAMVKALPIANFIQSLVDRGVDEDVMADMKSHSESLPESNLLNGLTEKLFDLHGVSDSFIPSVPVPKIDRTEVYGEGWGGFA